jgi:hypothetical protein
MINESSTDIKEVIKLLLVKKILYRYKKIRSKINVYTEFSLLDDRIADVYFENWESKSSYVFEIQKNLNGSWEKKAVEDYKDCQVPYMKTCNLIIVPLKEAPDNIIELSKWLEKFIV